MVKDRMRLFSVTDIAGISREDKEYFYCMMEIYAGAGSVDYYSDKEVGNRIREIFATLTAAAFIRRFGS